MKRFVRWFLISGSVGVLVAATLFGLNSLQMLHIPVHFNFYVILTLAPAMILGMAEPTSIWSELALFAIVFATNFVLYGILGLILCGIRSCFPHSDPAT
jgi:uncharacterized membrane protein YesL